MGYERRPLSGGLPPFELKFGVKPRMAEPRISANPTYPLRTRATEIMAVYSKHAQRVVMSMPCAEPQFRVGDLVLLYREKKRVKLKLSFGEPM